MRVTVFDAVADRARDADDVWFLTGDLGWGQTDRLAQVLGHRFLNVGVAEQNLISVATGLALAGDRAVAYSIGPFALLRAADQFRSGPVTHIVPVTLICGGSGLSYGTLGFSHFALEDVALLRAFPGVRILTPTTAAELEHLCSTLWSHTGPQYVRLERECIDGPITSLLDAPDLSSFDIAVVGYGAVMEEAVAAVAALGQAGTRAVALSVPVMDGGTAAGLRQALAGVDVIVTVEEHSARGGLGSLVAEMIATTDLNARLAILGTDDSIRMTWGNRKHLREQQGLTPEAITLHALAMAR